jgi:hydroxymethylbilane synthase
MKKKKFLIGSRGSSLALCQTEKVLSGLRSFFPGLDCEVLVVKTSGDRSALAGPAGAPLQAGEEQGVFTKEIDEALQKGTVDFAVHSAKDLPTQTAGGLEISAVLERDDARDAWISPRGCLFADLPAGASVATSSLRRRAQLLRLRPDLKIVEIRGNVATRVRKTKEGAADGLVLAACGLSRLGLEGEITEIFESPRMLPAVSQGAIAVETRAADPEAGPMARRLNHADSACRVAAERSLLAALRGGCQIPVGAVSRVEGDDLFLEAAVFSPDGDRFVSGSRRGKKSGPAAIGKELAAWLIENGGAEILEMIRRARPLRVPGP